MSGADAGAGGEVAFVRDGAMLVDRVRLTSGAKRQLTTLTRRTGIAYRNVLCRWALCLSLAESSPPREIEEVLEGGLEIDWRTFTGGDDVVYATLVRERCREDGLGEEPAVLAHQLRLHLHRGIAYLVGNASMDSITAFVELGTPPATSLGSASG